MTDSAQHIRRTIGVDVGGTKVAGGLVTERGELGPVLRIPMNVRGTAAEGFAAVSFVVDQLVNNEGGDNASISIGVCAPGPLDPRTGVVLNPPNVPCWRNFPLVAEIQRRYRSTARLDNDANAAALAESLWGEGRGYSNVFYACVGTGIGTGIVLDGKIFHGRTGAAAEGGHISIDYRGPACNCGKKGCIEALASGTAIARRGREMVMADPKAGTQLLGLANGDANAIRSEMIGIAAEMGDPVAQQILADTIEFLAVWLGNIVDLLEPEVMILGGGVSEMLRPRFPRIQDRLRSWCVNGRCCEIPLVPAHYGENSGIAGGAALCFLPVAN